jgi:hypothetical protein
MSQRQIKRLFIPLVLLIFVVGCATQPKDLPTTYVSPNQYQHYSCDQITLEMNRASRKANELQAKLKQDADNDAAQMAVGLVIFWPALFFLEGGDGPEAAEYSRLKGEFEALEEVSIQKKCGVEVQTATTTVTATTPSTGDSKSLKEQLRELREMVDEGLISEEDYETRKSQLLEQSE